MDSQTKMILSLVLITVLFMGCARETIIKEKESVDYVKNELQKLVPVDVKYDLSQLSKNEQKVVTKLIEAGKIIDELFLLQVDRDNLKIREELINTDTTDNKYFLTMFDIMFGSWNRLDENHPFINNEPKPKGAGYYPIDMTKEEFENYIDNNPDMEAEFTSHFTIIERSGED